MTFGIRRTDGSFQPLKIARCKSSLSNLIFHFLIVALLSIYSIPYQHQHYYYIMISSVEWVPRGVADPNPKQYELSAAEQELLLLNQAEYQEEDDVLDEQEQAQETITTTKTVTLPKVDPNSLPAELRMDEYSSDEDENEAVKGMSIGTLLVNTDEEDTDNEEQVMEDQDWETDDSDNDMDSDDDLNDIPDTREFAPTDLEGLQAMGLSHVGAGAAMNLEDQDDHDADDDDSDADDVRLSPDDAIIVVAKTEEVGEMQKEGGVLVVFNTHSSYNTLYPMYTFLGLCFFGSSRVRRKDGKLVCPSRYCTALLSTLLGAWRCEFQRRGGKLLCSRNLFTRY